MNISHQRSEERQMGVASEACPHDTWPDHTCQWKTKGKRACLAHSQSRIETNRLRHILFTWAQSSPPTEGDVSSLGFGMINVKADNFEVVDGAIHDTEAEPVTGNSV